MRCSRLLWEIDMTPSKLANQGWFQLILDQLWWRSSEITIKRSKIVRDPKVTIQDQRSTIKILPARSRSRCDPLSLDPVRSRSSRITFTRNFFSRSCCDQLSLHPARSRLNLFLRNCNPDLNVFTVFETCMSRVNVFWQKKKKRVWDFIGRDKSLPLPIPPLEKKMGGKVLV